MHLRTIRLGDGDVEKLRSPLGRRASQVHKMDLAWDYPRPSAWDYNAFGGSCHPKPQGGCRRIRLAISLGRSRHRRIVSGVYREPVAGTKPPSNPRPFTGGGHRLRTELCNRPRVAPPATFISGSGATDLTCTPSNSKGCRLLNFLASNF